MYTAKGKIKYGFIINEDKTEYFAKDVRICVEKKL